MADSKEESMTKSIKRKLKDDDDDDDGHREPPAEKTKRDVQGEDNDDDDDDGWIGPLPSEAARTKKERVLEYENLYLSNIPHAENYERSYMHRDSISFVAASQTEFIITASCDGHVKFWKKQQIGIEFVKHFRAHLGNIQGIALNFNGTLLCTISNDKNTKFFDVVNFDMINMRKLGFSPECCQWIHRSGDAIATVAITDADSSNIHIFDGRGDPKAPALRILERIHMHPVTAMCYNPKFDVVVSSDNSGMIEYWAGQNGDYEFPKNVMFDSKLDTDLFDFAKNKTHALNMTMAPNGKLFATFGADRKIRIYRFLSGKLYCVIDESLEHYFEMQKIKQMYPTMDFNRKVATEKELEKAGALKFNNIEFDKTGNFIMYSSLSGIKVVNIYTNKGSRMLGRSEHMRFLNVALFQGLVQVSKTASSVEIVGSENPSIDEGVCDPTLFLSAYKKNRFYMFTKREPKDTSNIDSDRDVFNEKPSKEDIIAATEESGAPRLFEFATIHTAVGDIHIQLFPRECPKTVENFCVHAKNGYFNGHIFHRVIKQFMIQTGDPTGIGTGGESIWGGEFEDEFHPKLRHDRPYTVSMANSGPNTNGSQFFITVVPTPWLDNKHTVFGRVVRGMEVALSISNAKAHPKTDKPYDEITIVSVSVKSPVRL